MGTAPDDSEIENLRAEISAISAELEQLRDHDRIRTTTEWIATTHIDEDPLVSVPTRTAGPMSPKMSRAHPSGRR